MRRRRRRAASARSLVALWIAILVVLGVGVLVLAWLGPPPHPHPTSSALPVAPRAARAPSAPAAPPVLAARPIPPQIVRPIAAPEAALLEPTPGHSHELLPRIGASGLTSITAYAGSFDTTDPRPRVGLIVAGIGLDAVESKTVINELPAAVTLAFSPYAPDPAGLAALARAKGHEYLISLPLEPSGYPLSSAGDASLLVDAPPGQNLAHLEWALSRITGYVGATGAMAGMYGDHFSAVAPLLLTLERRLAGRGLLYIDARAGKPDPEAAIGRSVDVIVDQPAIDAVIKANLAKLEAIARERGSALGIVGWAGPRTLQELTGWAAGLPASGLVLAPVTALVRHPAPAEAAR